MSEAAEAVVPLRRIDVLDVLRGLAILGIFYMNIVFMGGLSEGLFGDIRLLGWTTADRIVWSIIDVLLEGTQRGMLEFLFGAGMLILARRAMTPDGPVDVADRYYRRNLWLLLFGFVNIFVFLWPGDILHIYALAALPLFLFRRLPVRWLLMIGSSYALITAATGTMDYASRSMLAMKVEAIEARVATGTALTPAQATTLAEWAKVEAEFGIDQAAQARIATERAARSPGAEAAEFVTWMWTAWADFAAKYGAWNVYEAFCAMLIGVALFKLEIIQGERSASFYLRLMLTCYAIGLGARAVGATELLAFAPIPKTGYATSEFARLATSLGHVALVNWLVQRRWGATLLSPFRAAGRTAFSLYFMQQLVGIVLFAPFALGLWAQFGWAALAGIATLVIAAQLVIANLWVRHFVNGPFEWLWRSLSAVERQPFRRRVG